MRTRRGVESGMRRIVKSNTRLASVAGLLFLGGSLSVPLSCRQKSITPPAGADGVPAQTAPSVPPQASAAPPNAPLNAAQPNSDNPGVVDIPDVTPYSQVLAVSDNHGMLKSLKRLLKTARIIDEDGKWTGGNTLLIVAGDMIDKGPKSLEVVDLWMQLSAPGSPIGRARRYASGQPRGGVSGRPRQQQGRSPARRTGRPETSPYHNDFSCRAARQVFTADAACGPRGRQMAVLPCGLAPRPALERFRRPRQIHSKKRRFTPTRF